MKLSIITINLNNASGFQKTIESVISQTFTDFEYIVIDGGSTDGSVDVIKKYADKISYWVSEPDKGIYNAMNKGIKNANGEYLQFLNSGDWLVDKNVLAKIFSIFFCEDIIYGNRIEVYEDKNEKLNKGHQKSNLSFIDILSGRFFHTCSFSKKKLFEQYGYFDENFKIISDFGFFLKVIGLGYAKVKYIDIPISYFDMTGISKIAQYKSLHDKELEEIKKEIGSLVILANYEQYLKYVQYGRMLEKLKSSKILWFFFRVLYKISHYLTHNLEK